MIVEIHNYDYRYVVKDFLAKGADGASLILLMGQYFVLFLAGIYQQHSLNIFLQTVVYALQVAYNLTYMPFKNWRIQRAQISRNLINLALFLFLLLDIYSSISDFFFCILVIIPISSELGSSFYQKRLDHIVDKFFSEAQNEILQSEESNQSQSLSKSEFFKNRVNLRSKKHAQETSGSITNHEIDVFLRFLQENLSCEYDGYANDPQSPYLEEIIILHKQSCSQKQFCFCNKEYQYEDCSRKEFLGKEVRQQFLNSFIMGEYKKKMIGGGSGERGINELNFSFWCFLIDIMQSQKMSFVETIKVKNSRKRLDLSNREEQNLETIYQHALMKFGNLTKGVAPTGKQTTLQLLDTLMFDQNLTDSQVLYFECLKDQKKLLLFLSTNFLNLEELERICSKVRLNKKHLSNQLDTLLSINPASSILLTLQNEFELSLSNSQKLSKKYQHITANPKMAIHSCKLYEYSKETCVVFISLLSNIGQVIKVSKNFENVVPLYPNEDVIGKNINFMQPVQIGNVHNQILNNFVQKEAIVELVNFPLIIGIDSQGWAIPYAMRVIVSQISDNEIGATSWIKQIKDKNIYMTINGNEPHNFYVTGEKFYQLVLQDIFSQNELSNVSLTNIIPMMKLITSKYSTGIPIETIIIKPKSRSDCVSSHIDISKRGGPNIFLDISKYDLFICKAQCYKIKNKFACFLEICMSEILPVVTLFQLKDAVRLLATQLSDLAHEETEIINEQFEKFQEVFNLMDNDTDQKSGGGGGYNLNPLKRDSFYQSSQKIKSEKSEKGLDKSVSIKMEFQDEKYYKEGQAQMNSEKFLSSERQMIFSAEQRPSLSRFHSSHQKLESQISFPSETQVNDLAKTPGLSTTNAQITNQSISNLINNNINNATASNYQNTSLYEAMNLISPRILQGSSTRDINYTSHRDPRDTNSSYESPIIPIEITNLRERKEIVSPSQFAEEGKIKIQLTPTQEQKLKLQQKINSQFRLFQDYTMEIYEDDQIIQDKDQNSSVSEEEGDEYFKLQQQYSNKSSNKINKVRKQTYSKDQKQIQSNRFIQRNQKVPKTRISQFKIKESPKEASSKQNLPAIKKRNQQDLPAEGSVQSANTHRSSPKMQMLRSIQRRKKYLSLRLSNGFSATFLLLLLVLNLLHFNQAYVFLNDEKNDFQYFSYSNLFLQNINNIISDYTVMLLSETSALNYNSNQSASLVTQIFNEEKNLTLENIVYILKQEYTQDIAHHYTFEQLNTEKFTLRFIADYPTFFMWNNPLSKFKFYEITTSIGYSRNIILTRIKRQKQQDISQDSYNMEFFHENYSKLSSILKTIDNKQNNHFNDSFGDQKANQVQQLIESILISIVFSFLVAATCIRIQQRRERILRLFSTISSEDIQQMLKHLQSSIERATPTHQEILERHRRILKNSNAQDLLQHSHLINKQLSVGLKNNDDTFVNQQNKKKRTISGTSSLSKFSLPLIISLMIAFLFLQSYALTNLVSQSSFIDTIKQMREIKEIISTSSMRVSETIQSFLSSILLQLSSASVNQNYLSYFTNLVTDCISTSTSVLQNLQDCNSQYSKLKFISKPQISSNAFPSEVLEQNACSALNNQTTLLPSTSILSSEEGCRSLLGSSLVQGMISSLKVLFSSINSFLEISNASTSTNEFVTAQGLIKSNVNIFDIYTYKRAAIDVLNSLIIFIEMQVVDLFEVTILINTVAISIQAYIIIFIVILVWILLQRQITHNLHNTQLLLDVVDISSILNNSYVISYFKTR